MARCDTCGNDYDKAFEVRHGGRAYVFDCIECAAQALAPVCAHCGCRVLGHGIEQDDTIFCCASCVRAEKGDGVRDRADATPPPVGSASGRGTFARRA